MRIPKIGDRVRITGPMDDPDPVPVGTGGTVDWVGGWESALTRQVGVTWDTGSRLILLADDPYVIL